MRRKESFSAIRMCSAALAIACGFAAGTCSADVAGQSRAVKSRQALGSDQDTSRYSDYLTGRVAQLDHDWKSAGDRFYRAWEADRDDTSLRHDALLLSAAGGNIVDALEIARVVTPDSSDAPLANFLLTIDEFAQGRYQLAQEKLAAAPQRGLETYLTPVLNAWCEVGRGRRLEALNALAPLDALEGAGELRWLQTAMVADALGDRDKATEVYARLLDGKPSTRVLVMAANFFERQGALDKARAAIQRLDPDGASSSLRITMLARLGQKGHAPAPPDPRDGAADALFEIAAPLAEQKQADIAPLLYVRLALHLKPDFPSALLLLAEIDQRAGRMDDAVATLQTVDPRSDIRSTADRLAMSIADKAGETDLGLKIGQSAVKAHPEDIDLVLTYADLLRQKSRFPEAIAAYDSALARVSQTSNRRGLALYHRGIAYQQAHQWPHAETDLLAALQLRPDDPGLLNYLAFSWADQGVNLDRARTMLERAVQLVPDDGAIVDSLGWVMFRAGDFADAVTQLEHAVSLDIGDPVINDHLGDAYWRVGRLIEARGQWEKAARLSDDKALIEQIRIKLRDGLDPGTSPRHAAAE